MTLGDLTLDPALTPHREGLAALAAAAGLSTALTVTVEPGPGSTLRVSLTPGSGYPGQAVVALLAGDRLFHALLGRGLSALCDTLGWFEHPPSADALLMAFGLVERGIPLFPAQDTTPELVVARGQLTLRAMAQASLDPEPRRLELVLTPYAPLTVRDLPADEPLPAPLAIDDVTRWIRTIESGSLDSLAAVRSLAARNTASTADSRPRKALIKATTHWQEALWVEALCSLNVGDPSIAGELADAWTPLDASARQERLAVVAEVFGSVPAKLTETDVRG